MDESFLSVFDLIALGCGVYCLYTYYKLRTSGALFKNALLIPNGKSPKECLDEAAYIAYLQPKLLVISIVTFLFGLVSLINEQFGLYGFWVSEALTAVSLLTVIWYGVCSAKANRRYW